MARWPKNKVRKIPLTVRFEKEIRNKIREMSHGGLSEAEVVRRIVSDNIEEL